MNRRSQPLIPVEKAGQPLTPPQFSGSGVLASKPLTKAVTNRERKDRRFSTHQLKSPKYHQSPWSNDASKAKTIIEERSPDAMKRKQKAAVTPRRSVLKKVFIKDSLVESSLHSRIRSTQGLMMF